MDYKKININNLDKLIEIWKNLMSEHKEIESELYTLSEIAEEIY